MKKYTLTAFVFLIVSASLYGQNRKRWEDIDSTGYYQKDIQKKKGYTLVFINTDRDFNPATGKRLQDLFWKVYPQELKRFNKKGRREVTVAVTSEYKGVAAAWNGVIKIDPSWLAKNPEDIDLLTHELMHVAQGYAYESAPVWLTEGIADYARFAFGINNGPSKWSLTPFNEKHSYTNSYRIAARFLVWLEKNKRKDIVDRLNKAAREKTYTPAIWKELAGADLDTLWNEYKTNPAKGMPS
ncbi:secretory protein [Pedobacter yulinensis]|uniref:Secretory protein n=1 Tax=Pedobacter yulinensis TaxID=2126353 RepID=A0A2T3HK80_9SPHI|nr:basic secretory protein-like protein [Pedobacter yulinensis]PST82847.1 secretory protein [Pedobacter yulinensis]